MKSGKNILIEDEKWLDCLNLAVMVPDGEIPIVKFRVDGILDDFVIAVILVLRRERALPMPAISQLIARNDVHQAPVR
ncbi:MAG TPA: hypothetical protein VNO18_07700 [Xanthobacteraceae bacterium]|nr:hypothetical protein [Xanthobacteraceae bacterium]